MHYPQINKLKQLVELSLTLSGDPIEIFRHAAKMIGELLEVKVVCLSEIQGGQLNFLAVYIDGEIYCNAGVCSLAITPCATVEQSKDIKVYDRVAELFPEATFLKDHNAFAYCGFPSLDNQGKVVAVTCLLDNKPHDFTIEDQSFLRILGQRIGMEIERKHNLEENERANEILRINEDRLHQATHAYGIGIFDQTYCNKSIYSSPELRKLCGWGSNERVTFKTFMSSVYPKDRIRVMDAIRHAQNPNEGGLIDIEHRIIHRNGEVKWLVTRSQTFFETNELGSKAIRLVGAVSDITDRKRSEEDIHFLANFDSLTGLPNRIQLNHHFKYTISLEKRYKGQLALMFLDLDHFKDINDSLGHSVGDTVLIELAKRLSLLMRVEDTVTRLGGDEFILLLPGVDQLGAAQVAQKILDTISTPYLIEHQNLTLTASIGIALYPEDGEDLETLSKSADIAMYCAKREGRQYYRFFTPEMQKQSERNLQLVNALRHALEYEQLYLHYQPQVAIQSNLIIGAEALLRWQHPTLGRVSPAEFIPIAEESRLILPIGEWVLRTAIRQAKAWMNEGFAPMIMAVNLSAVQFCHPDLPELITRLLDEEGLPPEYLELELTEGVAMHNPEKAIAVMENLHERGIRMSIDDFGTGYSSLSYLKKFKAYKLKIDQSFVRDISTNPEDKAIVRAIISLAKNLGLQTIAEGVETVQQRALLMAQGCDEMQGYLFSEPLPIKEFEKLLRSCLVKH
ncbi:MAG: EAL domain-containing protein [Methylococcales bacterium]